MTDQETINVNLQRQIDAQNARIDNVLAKVDSLVEESKQQREDFRRLRERQDAMQAQHNADMKELREDIKGSLRHIQGLTIASMVGIVAIAGATWAFMWSSTRNETPSPSPPAQTAQAATQNHSAINPE